MKAVAANACKGPAEIIFNPASAGVAEAEPAPQGPGALRSAPSGPEITGTENHRAPDLAPRAIHLERDNRDLEIGLAVA